MKITLKHNSVQMLLALLRASLHERDVEMSFFESASPEDWKLCYRIAAEQGVMALAWDGVMKLPKALQPPLAVKISWASGVEAYEQKYLRYCRAVDEVSRFYAGHGIATMQMKGVGFSTLYPVPCHREGGDIDIYTYSADLSRMSHMEANQLTVFKNKVKLLMSGIQDKNVAILGGAALIWKQYLESVIENY